MTWRTCSSRTCASRPPPWMRSTARCPAGAPRITRASRTDMGSEDWRLHVVLEGEGGASWSHHGLGADWLASDMSIALGDRVAVSRDGDQVFLYAQTEKAARAAEKAVREDLDEHGGSAVIELTRWHDEAEEWKP